MVNADYMGHIIGTGIFAGLMIVIAFIAFFIVKKPNKTIVVCNILLTVLCLWLLWITVVIAQTNAVHNYHETALLTLWYTYYDNPTLNKSMEWKLNEEQTGVQQPYTEL